MPEISAKAAVAPTFFLALILKPMNLRLLILKNFALILKTYILRIDRIL